LDAVESPKTDFAQISLMELYGMGCVYTLMQASRSLH